KFLTEFAAGGAGTSNRRHWQQERRLIAILATLFSGKPCVRTARSGQTQRGRLTAVPLTPRGKAAGGVNCPSGHPWWANAALACAVGARRRRVWTTRVRWPAREAWLGF